MTAYLITADESVLDNEPTSFSRAITETIKFEPGVCWVFQRRLSRVLLTAVGYGVPRPRRVSTTQRVVNVTRLESLDEAVDLEDILAAVQELRIPPRHAPQWIEPVERLRGAGDDHAEAMEPGGASVMRLAVQELRQDMAEILERVESEPERVKVGGPAAPIWRLERDAIGLALRAAGFPMAHLNSCEPPDHADVPFSAGLAAPESLTAHTTNAHAPGHAANYASEELGSSARLPGLSLDDLTSPAEPSMIEYDSQRFPGWNRENGPGIRFDIKTFTNDNGRRVEIMSVNATPAESRTGVDLLYLRRDLKSLVGVQYKLLNRRDYLNPDNRLRDQLRRMRYWTDRFPHKNDSGDDWRLGEDWMYLKLLENGPLYVGDVKMLPGYYVALGYAEVLLTDTAALGPRGGVQLGPRTAHRCLDTATFTGLLQRTAIGSPMLQDDELALMFKIGLADLRSVIVAVDYRP